MTFLALYPEIPGLSFGLKIYSIMVLALIWIKVVFKFIELIYMTCKSVYQYGHLLNSSMILMVHVSFVILAVLLKFEQIIFIPIASIIWVSLFFIIRLCELQAKKDTEIKVKAS